MANNTPEEVDAAYMRVRELYPNASQLHLGDGWRICENGYGSNQLYYDGGDTTKDVGDAWIALDLMIRTKKAKETVLKYCPSATLIKCGVHGFQILHCNCPHCGIKLSDIVDTEYKAWGDATSYVIRYCI